MGGRFTVGDRYELKLVLDGPHSADGEEVSAALQPSWDRWVSELFADGVQITRTSPRPSTDDEQLDFPLRQWTLLHGEQWVSYTYWVIVNIDPSSPLAELGAAVPEFQLTAAPVPIVFVTGAIIVGVFVLLAGVELLLISKEVRATFRESGGKISIVAIAAAVAVVAFVFLRTGGVRAPPLAA